MKISSIEKKNEIVSASTFDVPMSRSSSVCLLPTTKNLKVFNVSATLRDAFDKAKMINLRHIKRKGERGRVRFFFFFLLFDAIITSFNFLINVLMAFDVFSNSFSCCRSFSRNSGESVNASVNSKGGSFKTISTSFFQRKKSSKRKEKVCFTNVLNQDNKTFLMITK